MSKTTDYAINQANKNNQQKDGFYYYHEAKKQLNKFDRTYDGELRLANLVNAIYFLQEAHKLLSENQSKPIYGSGGINPCSCQPEHNTSNDSKRV